jgi:hypothetical protein
VGIELKEDGKGNPLCPDCGAALGLHLNRQTLAEEIVCEYCWWSMVVPDVATPGEVADQTATLSLWPAEEEEGAA